MNTLIVISSPFQALCIIEYIKKYQLRDYKIVILNNKFSKVNTGCIKVLEEEGIDYSLIKVSDSYIRNVIDFIIKRSGSPKYDKVIAGDVLSIAWMLCCIRYARRAARIVFLDDGTSTIPYFSPEFSYFKRSRFSAYLKYIITSFPLLFLQIRKDSFFSIFDSGGFNKFPVIKNNFDYFKSMLSAEIKKGIYIIGTVNFDNSAKNVTLSDTIRKLINSIKSRHPKELIYYCPHRRDKLSEEIIQLLHENAITIFNTQVSVEYDFIKEKIYPLEVYGFGSTALVSLKMIYDNTTCYNIIVERKVRRIQSLIKSINEYYKSVGIMELYIE